MASIHPKVSASVIAGAAVGILIAEFDRHGIKIAPDEASNITMFISDLAAYFMPGDDPAAVEPPEVVIQPAAPAGHLAL